MQFARDLTIRDTQKDEAFLLVGRRPMTARGYEGNDRHSALFEPYAFFLPCALFSGDALFLPFLLLSGISIFYKRR